MCDSKGRGTFAFCNGMMQELFKELRKGWKSQDVPSTAARESSSNQGNLKEKRRSIEGGREERKKGGKNFKKVAVVCASNKLGERLRDDCFAHLCKKYASNRPGRLYWARTPAPASTAQEACLHLPARLTPVVLAKRREC